MLKASFILAAMFFGSSGAFAQPAFTATATATAFSTPFMISNPVNTMLKSCVLADIHAANDIPTAASGEYDCIQNIDAAGKLKAVADRDYKNWSNRLYSAGTTPKEITGYYSKNGVRCGELTSTPTAACPIALKALFVYKCGTGSTKITQGSDVMCLRASSVSTYYAIYQDPSILIPGEAQIKPLVIGDSVNFPNSIDASPVSSGKLSPYVYQGFDCKTLSDKITPKPQDWIQLGTNEDGSPICGPDPNQDTIDALVVEMCKVKMKDIWVNGGSTTAPCDEVRIDKIFKLNSNPAKTTADCTAAGGNVFFGSTKDPNLGGYDGGTIYMKGILTAESSFPKAKYGITTSSQTFDCKKQVPYPKGSSWSSSSSFTLDPEYVPNSLTVKLVGGGGGGSGSGTGSGGYGGGSGGYTVTSIPGAANASCTVTVGGGGTGGDTDVGCNDWPQGTTSGGGTSISCNSGGGSASVGGGAAGGQCAGGANGTAGGSSPMTGGHGGSSGGCGQGGSGGYYGAGGGGGSTDGSASNPCGAHSGGSGYGGYAEASWKYYKWDIFTP